LPYCIITLDILKLYTAKKATLWE